MKITPLPPLNSLVAFEAAARHLSFTRAAEELNVTQGAISRQMRLLEDYIGQKLFLRHNRNLSLSPAGTRYYHSIDPALRSIAKSTSDLKMWRQEHRLKVITSHAIASFWLLPKLSEFQQDHPDVDIKIHAVDSLQDIQESVFDIALFCCQTPPDNMRTTALFSERVFPVCSPDYLERHPYIAEKGRLCESTMLTLEPNDTWLSWQDWFNHCNEVCPGDDARRISMNNYPLIIQSALNGQGVALAWETLVNQFLDNQLLLRPCDTALATNSHFYLLEPEDVEDSKPSARKFRDWLSDQPEISS